MKNKTKLLLVILVLILSMVACGKYGDYSATDCEYEWDFMREITEPFDIVDMALNHNWAPGTTGDVLYQCISDGWDYDKYEYQ